jgi:L-ascorbate metabolism protein UlaG (beta-lactamase superfamily)
VTWTGPRDDRSPLERLRQLAIPDDGVGLTWLGQAGFILRLYHAGDTIHYPGMEVALLELAIDVAMLPINDRDPERGSRGIIGNLSEREAAWLAAAMGADVVHPVHDDLSARNAGSPGRLVESVEREHPGAHVLVPSREVPFAWAAGAAR